MYLFEVLQSHLRTNVVQLTTVLPMIYQTLRLLGRVFRIRQYNLFTGQGVQDKTVQPVYWAGCSG